MTTITLDPVSSLALAGAFLLAGWRIFEGSPRIRAACIPRPVIGAGLFIVLRAILRAFGYDPVLDPSSQAPLLVFFFATLGWGIGHFLLFREKIWADFLVLGALTLGLALLQGAAAGLCQGLLIPPAETASGSLPPSAGLAAAIGPMAFMGDLGMKAPSGAAAPFTAVATLNLMVACLLSGPAGILILRRMGIREPDDIRPEERQLHGIDVFTGKAARSTSADRLLYNAVVITIFCALAHLLSRAAGAMGFEVPAQICAFAVGSAARTANHYARVIDVPANTDSMNMLGYISLYIYLSIAMLAIEPSAVLSADPRIMLVWGVTMALTCVFCWKVARRQFGNRFTAAMYAMGLFSFGTGGSLSALSGVKVICGRFGFGAHAPLVIPVFAGWISLHAAAAGVWIVTLLAG